MTMEWQPIETARRDGTRVLVRIDADFLPHDTYIVRFDGIHWHDDEEQWFCSDQDVSGWMPLPQ